MSLHPIDAKNKNEKQRLCEYKERFQMKFMLPIMFSLIVLTSGCGRKSAVGFRLPDGNVEKGKAAFIELKCHSCHTVDGVTLPPPTVSKSKAIAIGGEVTRIKTYGELVTAIIHPSHRLSADVKKQWEIDGKLSPMPDYNRVMTVEQMINLVTFLQSRYTQLNPVDSILSTGTANSVPSQSMLACFD